MIYFCVYFFKEISGTFWNRDLNVLYLFRMFGQSAFPDRIGSTNCRFYSTESLQSRSKTHFQYSLVQTLQALCTLFVFESNGLTSNLANSMVHESLRCLKLLFTGLGNRLLQCWPYSHPNAASRFFKKSNCGMHAGSSEQSLVFAHPPHALDV